MLGSSQFSLLLVLQLCVCFLACIHALPAPIVLSRQDSGNSTTVWTTNTYESPNGPMTETCSITLTPMPSGPNGESVVQEITSCSVAPASSASGASSGSASSAATAAASPVDSSAPSVAPTPSATPASPQAISVDGLTTIPAPAVSTGAPMAASSSVVASSGAASALADNNPSPSAANNNSAPSATAAAAEAAVVTPFAIPGRKLMVLPVGLILFCVVTGIGMIVWALVTIERIKYRKTFRKRRLAEEGAPMGYGGLAPGIGKY